MKRLMRLAKWMERRARWLTLGVVVLMLAPLAAFLLLDRIYPFPIERLNPGPQSPRVTDRHGETMLALVASDGQWRRQASLDAVASWVPLATVAVEDERFQRHYGVDPIAILRAAWQNLKAGRVVSGGSTISMQVCRMIRDKRGRSERSIQSKLIEAFRALQLERCRSKAQILEAYFNLAPYGGNIVGIEEASRTWFEKSAKELSLGEAALLAGLPQSPSLLRPNTRPEAAGRRRAHVLARMTRIGMVGKKASEIAGREPLPKRLYLPRIVAPHAAWMALTQRTEGGRTTIDLGLQRAVEGLAREHATRLPAGSDMSAVIIDVATGNLVALLGSANYGETRRGQNNGALARRSPGSALKPFVYAAAFETGKLGPSSIVYDTPINRAGWRPSNFSPGFKGKLKAADALRRSLNIPAILVAESTGMPRCVAAIESAGVDLPDQALSRSGLAAVVGATEVRLIDLVNGYATLARAGVRKPVHLYDEASQEFAVLKAEACEAVNEILSTRQRVPKSLAGLARDSIPWFMWKTGTSAGLRDAWAVGHNRRYAVGVWVGRFSGEGRNEYVGERAAEPLLAAIMMLPGIAPRAFERTEPATPEPLEAEAPSLVKAFEGPIITAPKNKTIFLAPEGKAIVRVSAAQEEGASFFLNGRLVSRESIERLELEPGAYELRCADAEGRHSAVRFQVKRRPTGGRRS